MPAWRYRLYMHAPTPRLHPNEKIPRSRYVVGGSVVAPPAIPAQTMLCTSYHDSADINIAQKVQVDHVHSDTLLFSNEDTVILVKERRRLLVLF